MGRELSVGQAAGCPVVAGRRVTDLVQRETGVFGQDDGAHGQQEEDHSLKQVSKRRDHNCILAIDSVVVIVMLSAGGGDCVRLLLEKSHVCLWDSRSN